MRMQAPGASSESDYGIGFNFLVAYDFDRNSTGLTFLLGAKVGQYDIEGSNVGGFSVFGNVVWKDGAKGK